MLDKPPSVQSPLWTITLCKPWARCGEPRAGAGRSREPLRSQGPPWPWESTCLTSPGLRGLSILTPHLGAPTAQPNGDVLPSVWEASSCGDGGPGHEAPPGVEALLWGAWCRVGELSLTRALPCLFLSPLSFPV